MDGCRIGLCLKLEDVVKNALAMDGKGYGLGRLIISKAARAAVPPARHWAYQVYCTTAMKEYLGPCIQPTCSLSIVVNLSWI